MSNEERKQVDVKQIKNMLKQKKRMKLFLSVCASCGFCADSCFLYRNKKDPRFMPSYKAINSLGRMFKKRGKLKHSDLVEIKDHVWGNCVMCRRCYCPFGIDISGMISWARTICRTQGVCERYDLDAMGVGEEEEAAKE
ncbi:4Fe-4S dicluster domain-containing protein [Spirochaetota bacterium]